jgi:hypothetical protein
MKLPQQNIFPLRLSLDLSNTLHTASTSTGITKSDLIRSGLRKYLTELDRSGIKEALTRLKSV